MRACKVLYIFQAGDFSNPGSGVEKKVLSKIRHLNTEAFRCDCISFSYNVNIITEINEHTRLVPVTATHRRKYFNSFYESRNFYKAIGDYISSLDIVYDFILFRYPGASYGLADLVRRFPGKFIFEHNTIEEVEIKMEIAPLRKTIPFSVKPGYFFYLFEIGYYGALAEKHLANKVFKKAAFGLSVTNEIALYEESRCPAYKNYVVSNGVEVASNVLREYYPFDGKNLRLFMLIGFKASWHGVDRLINSLKAYKGSFNVQVDIIGEVDAADLQKIEQTGLGGIIRILPPMSSAELDRHLNAYHIGLGALQAYMKEIREGSSLKVREYVSRGFPVVLAYNDTDISNDERYSAFCLQFPNNSSLIDFDRVGAFANKVYADRDHPQKIRELAFKTVDMKVKMQSIINICLNRL